jgi:ABC-type cobalamin transport system ATPase subunit
LRFTAFTALFFSLASSHAHAGCLDAYQREIREATGRLTAPRTALVINASTAAIATPTLYSAGVLSAGSVLILPVVAVAAGAYLGLLSLQRNSLRRAYLALKQSHAVSGPILEKLVKRVKRKRPNAELSRVREAVLKLDSKEAFCLEDSYKGSVKLNRFPAMVKQIVQELP